MEIIKLLKRNYNNKTAQLLCEIGILVIDMGALLIIIGICITLSMWQIFKLIPLAISIILFLLCYIKAFKFLLEAEKIELEYNAVDYIYNTQNHVIDIVDSVNNIEDLCIENKNILLRVKKSIKSEYKRK